MPAAPGQGDEVLVVASMASVWPEANQCEPSGLSLVGLGQGMPFIVTAVTRQFLHLPRFECSGLLARR